MSNNEIQAEHVMKYKGKNDSPKEFALTHAHFNIFEQAKKDYELAKGYIDTHWIHIWNAAVKSYLLYNGDRQAYIQDWQSNNPLGLVRSQIDTYISFLEQAPLQFVLNGLNKEAYSQPRKGQPETCLDYTRLLLNSIGQITHFEEQIGMGIIEGAQIGTTAYKTMVHAKMREDTMKLLVFVNNEFMEIEYANKQYETPWSECVDMYHIFPDPDNEKNPQYVFERAVVSQKKFMDTYATLIMSDDNELKWTEEDLAEILTNDGKADFSDYGNIRDDIYAHHNKHFSQSDALYQKNRTVSPVAGIVETGSKTGKVEFKFGQYADRFVLIANNYPLYIGTNEYGRILMKFVTAFNSRGLFSEGLHLLLYGVESVQNSFWNNYIDNGRAMARNSYLVNRNDFDGEPDIENAAPGSLHYVNRLSQDTIRPFPIQQVTDFGIMQMSDGYANRLSGISEIDQGQASRTRVAAEGAALVGATNRRLNSYINRYFRAVGGIGSDWIDLWRRQHINDKEGTFWGVSRDIDGKDQQFDINIADVAGSYNCTLDSQGLFAMNREAGLQKKMDMYRYFETRLTDRQAKRHMQAIYRDAGMSPSVYLPEEEELAPKPAPAAPAKDPKLTAITDLYGDQPPEAINGQDMAAAMNTQIDLGNG